MSVGFARLVRVSLFPLRFRGVQGVCVDIISWLCLPCFESWFAWGGLSPSMDPCCYVLVSSRVLDDSQDDYRVEKISHQPLEYSNQVSMKIHESVNVVVPSVSFIAANLFPGFLDWSILCDHTWLLRPVCVRETTQFISELYIFLSDRKQILRERALYKHASWPHRSALRCVRSAA